MDEPKLILKRYGLMCPTEVHYEYKILVTNELDVKMTCDLWKWYFHLPPFGKIVLYTDERNYNAMQQKPFAFMKSVAELFYDNGFILKKLEPSIEDNVDWCIIRQSELNKLNENADK